MRGAEGSVRDDRVRVSSRVNPFSGAHVQRAPGKGFLSSLNKLAAAAFAIGALTLAGIGFGAAYLNNQLKPDRILPGVRVLGVGVGGKTVAGATEAVKPVVDHLLYEPILLAQGERKWRFLPEDAGIRYDLPRMIEEAYAAGRLGSLWHRLREHLSVIGSGYDVPVRLSVGRDKIDSLIQALSQEINQPAQDAAFEILPDETVLVRPSRAGIALDTRKLAADFQKVMGRSGQREVHLSVREIPPKVSTADLEKMEIREKIASYRTKFDPDSLNRAQNIKLSAVAVGQKLLAPDEIFSFNRQVGPRLPESGYQEAPVVVNGKLVPGVGGGVCQVSSTLYNAVLLADLEIITRNRHSLPSAYVAVGRDATVAYDYLDFRFRNNSGRYILVDVHADHRWVETRVFGMRTPGKTVAISVETLETIPPGKREEEDPALPPGASQVAKRGVPGYRVKVWREVAENGAIIRRELVSQDRYAPIDEIVKIGVGRGHGKPAI